MNFNKFVGEKVVLSAMPNLRIEGKVLGIKNTDNCGSGCDGDCCSPWMEIELSADDKTLDGKTALVDCGMITCVVEME